MSAALRLLVVDDDDIDRLAVRRALQKARIDSEIVEADSAAAALDLLRSNVYDCVLLDYQLPGSDGLKVLKQARDLGYNAPIVVLTGQGDDEVAVNLMKSGASDYLSKAALSPDRLVQSIRSAIRISGAEQQAREAEAALRASEARFRILHETSPDAFMIFRAVRNAEGEFVDAVWEYTNAAGERVSGFSADELRGRSLLELMPGARETGLFDLYREVLETGESRQTEVLYDADGYDLWVRVTAAKLGDGFAVSSTDVTPRRRAEQERERAMAAQSRFYAAMSHEIRTPMNAILGYTDLLLLETWGPLTPQQRNGLDRAHRAAQHLLELVNDVLDLSKIEAGKLEVQMEPVGLQALIRDLFTTVQPIAQERGVEFRFDLEGCPGRIVSDPRRLRQILLNLFSNAIKFGGARPVDVRCESISPNEVIVEVIDQGPGIPEADQDRIFEEFVQLTTEEARGTGLGLPISRRLATLLGGVLEVESQVGSGSIFRLTLPVGQPEGWTPKQSPIPS